MRQSPRSIAFSSSRCPTEADDERRRQARDNFNRFLSRASVSAWHKEITMRRISQQSPVTHVYYALTWHMIEDPQGSSRCYRCFCIASNDSVLIGAAVNSKSSSKRNMIKNTYDWCYNITRIFLYKQEMWIYSITRTFREERPSMDPFNVRFWGLRRLSNGSIWTGDSSIYVIAPK